MLGPSKRAFANFRRHDMTDHAAALTYFQMMSLFPALLISVSLLGLLGDQRLVRDAVRYAEDNGAPPDVADALESALQGIVENAGGAVNVALVLGVAVALYGASGGFGAAGRALNVVFGANDDRPFVRHKLADIACTLVVILLAIVALVSVFLGGEIADDVFGTIGLGETAAGVWRVGRWAVALAATMLIYAFIYSYAPGFEDRRMRWVSPGAAAGVLIWLAASAGFFFYVANVGNYAAYGAFAGAVILLLWLYLTNLAFLFGAELNAELERRDLAGRGGPPPPSPPPSAGNPDAAPASAPPAARAAQRP